MFIPSDPRNHYRFNLLPPTNGQLEPGAIQLETTNRILCL